MIPSTSPVLGLRMQVDRMCPPSDFVEGCDHIERVQVMITQDEVTYSCSDYLARASTPSSSKKETSACDTHNDNDDDMMDDDDNHETSSSPDAIDAVCRERMCEWSMRVTDHFSVPREVVAISFNLLDRFIDRCACDRSAFKLASMTTLYMASKISGTAHRITVQALADLSRGEFSRSHIQEMETIILQTLDWRLNPPTAQCFINNFFNYLPVPQGPVSMAIYQRAMFFVELALYDYVFVTKKRTLLAMAALMNAMEGLNNECTVSQQQQDSFVEVICMTFGLKFTHEEIETVRNRLWYVYSMSAQYKEDDVVSPDMMKRGDSQRKHHDGDAMQVEEPLSLSHSPVSVTANPVSS